MIKEAVLLFSLVGFVDLEAEAQAMQQRSTPTTGASFTPHSGTDRGIRTRTSTSSTHCSATVRGFS